MIAEIWMGLEDGRGTFAKLEYRIMGPGAFAVLDQAKSFYDSCYGRVRSLQLSVEGEGDPEMYTIDAYMWEWVKE